MQGTTSTRYKTKRTPSGWFIVDTSEQVHGVPSMHLQVEKYKTRDEAERACRLLNGEVDHDSAAAGSPYMSPAARHVLNVIALRHDLPVDGWAHVLTSLGDDGTGRFIFDHEDGRLLTVNCTADGYEIAREHSLLVEQDERDERERWVVVDTKVAAGEHTPILGRFTSEHEAAEFISTLPEHESGRYGLDGPGEVS